MAASVSNVSQSSYSDDPLMQAEGGETIVMHKSNRLMTCFNLFSITKLTRRIILERLSILQRLKNYYFEKQTSDQIFSPAVNFSYFELLMFCKFSWDAYITSKKLFAESWQIAETDILACRTGKWNIGYYLVKIPDKNQYILCVRGTYDIRESKHFVLSKFTKFEYDGIQYHIKEEIHEAYLVIFEDIKDLIPEGSYLYCTGHSRGAPVCSLIAIFMRRLTNDANQNKNIQSFAWNFNPVKAFAKDFYEKSKEFQFIKSIIFGNDIIPRCDPSTLILFNKQIDFVKNLPEEYIEILNKAERFADIAEVSSDPVIKISDILLEGSQFSFELLYKENFMYMKAPDKICIYLYINGNWGKITDALTHKHLGNHHFRYSNPTLKEEPLIEIKKEVFLYTNDGTRNIGSSDPIEIVNEKITGTTLEFDFKYTEEELAFDDTYKELCVYISENNGCNWIRPENALKHESKRLFKFRYANTDHSGNFLFEIRLEKVLQSTEQKFKDKEEKELILCRKQCDLINETLKSNLWNYSIGVQNIIGGYSTIFARLDGYALLRVSQEIPIPSHDTDDMTLHHLLLTILLKLKECFKESDRKISYNHDGSSRQGKADIDNVGYKINVVGHKQITIFDVNFNEKVLQVNFNAPDISEAVLKKNQRLYKTVKLPRGTVFLSPGNVANLNLPNIAQDVEYLGYNTFRTTRNRERKNIPKAQDIFNPARTSTAIPEENVFEQEELNMNDIIDSAFDFIQNIEPNIVEQDVETDAEPIRKGKYLYRILSLIFIVSLLVGFICFIVGFLQFEMNQFIWLYMMCSGLSLLIVVIITGFIIIAILIIQNRICCFTQKKEKTYIDRSTITSIYLYNQKSLCYIPEIYEKIFNDQIHQSI